MVSEEQMNATLCDEATLIVRDAEGRSLLEYDPATKRATLHLPGASLEVRAVDGTLDIRSERPIRIRSDASIDIESDRLRLAGREMLLEAETAETRWGRLTQVARDLYLRVESLFHTRAGRMRTETKRSFVLHTDRARIEARGDMRIDGESIHLG